MARTRDGQTQDDSARIITSTCWVKGPCSSIDRTVPTWNSTTGRILRRNDHVFVDSDGTLRVDDCTATDGRLIQATKADYDISVLSKAGMYVYVGATTAGGGDLYAIQALAILKSAADVQTGAIAGVLGGVRIDKTGTDDITSLVSGVQGYVQGYSALDKIVNMAGGRFHIYGETGKALVVDDAIGVYVSASDIEEMIVDSYYGLLIEAVITKTGTLQNNYGIYIHTPTIGAVINEAIHLEGASKIKGSDAITIETGGAADLTLTPDGVGDLILDGLKWPQADGAANTVLYTNGAAQTAWGALGAIGGVTAGAAITDHAIVRGDGGAAGIQDTGILIDDNDHLLMPTTAEVRYRAADQRIWSSQVGWLDLEAYTIIQLNSPTAIPSSDKLYFFDATSWIRATASGEMEVRGAAEVDIVNMATRLRTIKFPIYIKSPTGSEDVMLGYVPDALTVVRFYGETDVGTYDFYVEERPEGSAFVAGTKVDNDVFQVDATGEERVAGFENAGLAAGSWLWLVGDAVASSPTKVAGVVVCTIDN